MTIEPAPQWTPEQGRRYELLCEVINYYSGHVMAEIYAEQEKPSPREGLIASFRAHLTDVHEEYKALRITDDAQINAAMAKYDALNKAYNQAYYQDSSIAA